MNTLQLVITFHRKESTRVVMVVGAFPDLGYKDDQDCLTIMLFFIR